MPKTINKWLKTIKNQPKSTVTNHNHSKLTYPNLTKNLLPIRPNIVWASDFTYIPFKNSFIYLATVLDIFSREIVGFIIRRDHSADLVEEAFNHAQQRSVELPLILHSDQGSEYKSESYTKLLKKHGINISMSK